MSCFNIFFCSHNADGHFPSGLSVQCHQLNSQISLPPERYELSLVYSDFLACLWQYCVQTDMLCCFLLCTSSLVLKFQIENLQGKLRIYTLN